MRNGVAGAVLVGLNRHGDLRWTFTATGATSDTSVLDPFGKPITATGSTNPNVGFQGDWTDPATGDVWMGARWYTPGTSNFRSRDSYNGRLASPVSLNRYTYAGNNPLRWFDPDGRCYECSIGAETLWGIEDGGGTVDDYRSSPTSRTIDDALEGRSRGVLSAPNGELDAANDAVGADTSACGADYHCRRQILEDRVVEMLRDGGVPATADLVARTVETVKYAAGTPYAVKQATEAACMASWFSSLDRTGNPFDVESRCRSAASTGRYRPSDFPHTDEGMDKYRHVFVGWAAKLGYNERRNWSDPASWGAAGEIFAGLGGLQAVVRAGALSPSPAPAKTYTDGTINEQVASNATRPAPHAKATEAGSLGEIGPAGNPGSLRTVIGKVGDLEAPGAIGSGERTLLGRLPDQGSPAANWVRNDGVLRQEMGRGMPIRDASVNPVTGALERNTGFLRAERYLLGSRGWTYDPKTTMWYPPS